MCPPPCFTRPHRLLQVLSDAGNPCASVSCGAYGSCFSGVCVCDTASGYSGSRCEVPPQPINANVSEWSAFSDCTFTCGSGSQTRTRTCVPPQFGGTPCPVLTDSQVCNTQPCVVTVDGGFSEWSEWGACNATCPTDAPTSSFVPGVQVRRRQCNNPIPSSNGRQCAGAFVDTRKHSRRCGNSAAGGWGNGL